MVKKKQKAPKEFFGTRFYCYIKDKAQLNKIKDFIFNNCATASLREANKICCAEYQVDTKEIKAKENIFLELQGLVFYDLDDIIKKADIISFFGVSIKDSINKTNKRSENK